MEPQATDDNWTLSTSFFAQLRIGLALLQLLPRAAAAAVVLGPARVAKPRDDCVAADDDEWVKLKGHRQRKEGTEGGGDKGGGRTGGRGGGFRR